MIKNVLKILLMVLFLIGCSSGSSEEGSPDPVVVEAKTLLRVEGSDQYDKLYFYFENDKLIKIINYQTWKDFHQLIYQENILKSVILANPEHGGGNYESYNDFSFDLANCVDCLKYDYEYSNGKISFIRKDGIVVGEYKYDGENLGEYKFYIDGELHRKLLFSYQDGKLHQYSITEYYAGESSSSIFNVVLDDKINPFFKVGVETGIYIPNAPSIFSKKRLNVNFIPNNVTSISDSDGNEIFKVVYQYDADNYPISYELLAQDVQDSGVFIYE
ncbi:hypothetical protein [Aestuariibaculum lutulentum]|uniref:DUF4595 domain-containing protein n=1 Tax=Aestuariibaculum lutulentum TaxID=2920935 RepID=A0ABS9RGA2_9FLAO|nr:hypothetical protein [Aestuariibaculum lutulentum]MCH4551969.1 hypothetical protein [Aestuariibaculum lutulentum]